jgi:glycosyltransferase involved in cell wall biosynthesis
MQMPRLSVVTPCYNAARFIGRTLDSLQRQTCADWELVVVDDGSTDHSAEIVGRHAAGDERIRLIRQPNGHVCRARNTGVAATDPGAEYLLFLDADDMLEPRAIETMLAYLDRHPDVGLAYCSLRLIGLNDESIDSPGFGRWWDARYVPTQAGTRQLPRNQAETPLAALVAGYRAIPSTTFIRRRVFATTSGWDESFRQGGEDMDLVVQIALQAPVHFVPKRLVRYRRHDANFSNQDFGPGIVQFRRKWWDNPRLSPAEQATVREAIVFAQRLPMLLDAVHANRMAALGKGILQLCGLPAVAGDYAAVA